MTLTDPLDADTDDGGVPDGDEVELGTDPLDPSDDVAIPGGDTGDTGDTGEIDSGTPDTGTSFKDYYSGGCGCSSAPEQAPNAAVWMAAGLVGVGLISRRRRV